MAPPPLQVFIDYDYFMIIIMLVLMMVMTRDGDDDGDLLSMMNNQDGRAPALGPGGDFKKVSR